MIYCNCSRIPPQISRSIFKTIQRNVSALYITGDKAKENFAVLTPFFEFNRKLLSQEELRKNILRRKLTINVPQLYQLWDMYRDVVNKKKHLEKKRIEIACEMKKAGNDENLKRKYQSNGTRIREELKILKEHLYPLECKFINEFLQLPNDIHSATPIDSDFVEPIVTHLQMPDVTKARNESHLKYTDLIEFNNLYNYYLKGDAAKFDLVVPMRIVDLFKKNGYNHFSNPDFLKTVGVEAAGFTADDCFKIVDDSPENRLNMLHVVGKGSMLSYLGYITKLSIFKSHMPMRLISSGKEYEIVDDSNDSFNKMNGLFAVSQSTVVQLFEATIKSDAQYHFDTIIQKMIQLYKMFGVHFRVIYTPANQLENAEYLRADFEMYSPSLQQYVTVGNLSHYSDYISKRLLFNYRDDNKTLKFPYLISGTVVNVTKLLAILLENKKFIPPLFDSLNS